MKRSWALSGIVLVALTLAGLELALSAEKLLPVPVGRERRARDWNGDVTYLLFSRRTAASDLVGGRGGLAFNPKDCLRCHENAAGVEGQIFYGPAFKDFARNQWPEMLSKPESGVTPIRSYDYFKTHRKPVNLVVDVFPEQVLKQNP